MVKQRAGLQDRTQRDHGARPGALRVTFHTLALLAVLPASGALDASLHESFETLATSATETQIPCSSILHSLKQRPPCLEQRKLIQARCYGGIPDPGHKQAIDDLERGLKACKELQVVNCGAGHPMSGL